MSILGFGCMRLPVIDNDTTRIDDAQAITMVRHAIDEGVDYLDTAFPYHSTSFDKGGESEPFLARALRDGYRKKVNIATKLPSWLIRSRDDMDRYLDRQLERLETSQIDFYLVHALNTTVWPTLKELGIRRFLDSAIRDGRIRHAGFSFHDQLSLFKEIVDYHDWAFCQIQYNYLDEAYQAGTEGLRYAADRGLAVVIMEPLRGGHLAARFPDGAMEALRDADPSRSPAEWALRWVWNHPEVSVVLSGMTSMEHVVENIQVARDAHPNSLTGKELAAIGTARDILRERMAIGCTGCGYCQPCPQGVAIPKIFSMYNDYHLFDTEAARGMARLLYALHITAEERADRCARCGECESHCPQSLPIMDELEKARTLLA